MVFWNRDKKNDADSLGEEMDFSEARKKMVKEQLKRRGIADRRVLEAMNRVPRERFILENDQGHAYSDGPLPIGGSQTISQPYIVALMSELLTLKGKEKVLEVGTGSGYQTAILSKLAKQVYSVERQPQLLKRARKVFKELSLANVKTRLGDGSLGWQSQAPFERILVTAAAKKMPTKLIDQLAEGGRIVFPFGVGFWQRLLRISKQKGRVNEEDFGLCAFVPLIEGGDR